MELSTQTTHLRQTLKPAQHELLLSQQRQQAQASQKQVYLHLLHEAPHPQRV